METEGRLYYSVKQFPQKLSLGGSKEHKQTNKQNKQTKQNSFPQTSNFYSLFEFLLFFFSFDSSLTVTVLQLRRGARAAPGWPQRRGS